MDDWLSLRNAWLEYQGPSASASVIYFTPAHHNGFSPLLTLLLLRYFSLLINYRLGSVAMRIFFHWSIHSMVNPFSRCQSHITLYIHVVASPHPSGFSITTPPKIMEYPIIVFTKLPRSFENPTHNLYTLPNTTLYIYRDREARTKSMIRATRV